jgi:isopentenyl-diphosphate Delta-isomerase
MSSDSNWPFADPRNVAVFTSKQIVRERQPILRVTHDEDDGAWQFHSGALVDEKDAMILALSEVCEIDPTIANLADLPLGWRATRISASSPWVRSKNAVEEIFDVVNERDEVIDRRSRQEVHRLGLKHRAVHVLVFNQHGEVFLQKRSMSKDSCPGLWDSSASGHLDKGEDYDTCAMRELREEIGLHLAHPPKRLFKIEARAETGQEFVWVYRCESDGPFTLHPEEIETGEWFSPAKVTQWMKERPQDFASAFLYIWERLPA